MKILNIIQCSNLGGMEQSTLASMSVLREAGHDVQMVSLHPAGALKDLAESRGVPLSGCSHYRWAGVGCIPELLRQIKAFQPDRILLTGHNFGSLLASSISGVHTCLSIHYHHGDRSMRLWKSFYALARKRCSRIRFISRFIYDEVAPLFTGYAKVDCFPNIFLPPAKSMDRKAARAALDIPENAFVVGNAGWLIHRKAFDIFLEVAAVVVKQVPEALFVMAGDGEERERLEGMVRQFGIEDSVRFLGWQKDLTAFYCALDVLLFNSRFDALGRTPVEALAHGIPVVASVTNGGLNEFIRHGQDGFLMDRHDVAALADEIVVLHGDPVRRESMAATGRRRVLEIGSPEHHLEQLKTFLEI